jgi:hypothetical protein
MLGVCLIGAPTSRINSFTFTEAGRLHRPLQAKQRTLLYTGTCEIEMAVKSSLYREIYIVYEILVTKPGVKRPLRK